MAPKAQLVREGRLGVLRIDNPPVNALSLEVITDLVAAIDAFEADRGLVALVVECVGRTFVAGGDISIFDDPTFSAASLNDALGRLEASDRPVVAALFGTVLGGGLEIALACHGRIAHPATRLGLPEVTLGLIPGSLGTQRLPRLIGLAAAASMMVDGKTITASAALETGLIDGLSDTPSEAARQAALAAVGSDLRRASRLSVPDLAGAGAVLANLDRDAGRRRYLPAIGAIARTLRAAVELPFAKGGQMEADEFAGLLASAPSRALRHIFFAERAARRIPGLPADTKTRPVAKVGILGVGTMGAGISMAFANAGIPVVMVETSDTALARGRGIIEKTYAASVQRGRMSRAQVDATLATMTGTTDLSALGEVDMVIEAVFEDMALKLDVAAKLGATCRPGAIIATNTSTLDVDRIAAATGRPQDVVGTHFFSPAQIMRLLEVVRGRETAPDVLQTVVGLAGRIGKTAVVSGVCYGFIGNRMAEVYGRENEALQLEGASPAQIDSVAESPAWIGLAMGPSRMLDMAGVDVGARTVIEWIKSGEGPQEPSYRAMCRALFEAGRHGQKTGEGYYLYDGRNPLPSQKQADLAADLAKRHGVTRRAEIPEREIFERLLYPMVNEAALILSEGIAYRPGDIDVVWTAGYGFPGWRGGPVFMADEIGLSKIVRGLDYYAATLGNDTGRWTVAPLLRALAAEGVRLSDWRP